MPILYRGLQKIYFVRIFIESPYQTDFDKSLCVYHDESDVLDTDIEYILST